VTAQSPAELNAERDENIAENRRVHEFLRRQPTRVQQRFRGRTFSAIKRDPRFRALVRQASPSSPLAAGGLRSRENGASPRRRASSSSRTSGTDPGSDSEGEPPPSLAALVGRPLANFAALTADLSGAERLEKFLAQPPAVQTVSYVALREAIERRRGAQ
jgi:hypothetical protein